MVRILYANLTYKYGIIESEFNKYPINPSLEDFAQVCNLPFIEQHYNRMDTEGKEFTFDTFAHTLLIDPSSIISFPFSVGLIRAYYRLIRYTINYVIFPRKSNYNTIKIKCSCNMVFGKSS